MIARDFLEAVGEEFDRLTGGYYYLYEPRGRAFELLRLRCELNDQRIDIFSPTHFATSDVPAIVAAAIAERFDRSERPHATRWDDLPNVDLERLLTASTSVGLVAFPTGGRRAHARTSPQDPASLQRLLRASLVDCKPDA